MRFHTSLAGFDLSANKVDSKLAQMILDRKLVGSLHQGNRSLTVFDKVPVERVHVLNVATVHAMNEVVDALWERTQKAC